MMNVNWKRLSAPAIMLAALILPPATVAQSGTQGRCRPRSINQRQDRQQTRIRQGVRSGELTRREAGKLAAQQAVITTNEAFARRSGGELTAKERARIQRQQNKASQSIHKQKHDGQDRN